MMNVDLIDSAMAQRLAMSLGHFLWQGVLIGALVLVFGWVARDCSRWQYGASVVALVMMAVCLPLNLLWVEVSPETSDPAAGQQTVDGGALVEPTSRGPATVPGTDSPGRIAIDIGDNPGTETNLFSDPDGANPVLPEENEHKRKDHARSHARQSVDSLGSATDMGSRRLATAATGTVDSSERNAYDEYATQAILATTSRHLVTNAPIVVVVYFCGVSLLLLRLLFAIFTGWRIRRASIPVSNVVAESAHELARRLGIRRGVFIGRCESIAGPVAIGLLRPAILFPAAVLAGLTPAQLELVLLHELSHFRRWDHLVVVMQRLVETVLFFHPVVWMVSRKVSVEREHCCDQDVLGEGARPVEYASCLLRVAEIKTSQQSAQAVTLASDGHRPSQLRARVSRILGMTDPANGRSTLSGVIAVLMVLGGCAWSLTRPHHNARADDDAPTVNAKSDDKAKTKRGPLQPVVSDSPAFVSLRYRLKDHNGNPVNTDWPFVRAYRGYANAKPQALVEQDGALQLAPGKQLLAYRPAYLGEAMLFDVDVPPKNSTKDFQLRRPATWLDKDSQQRMTVEAKVYERELGNRFTIKIKNVGDGDITLRRSDIQFVSRHWRIIPPEADWLHKHTLTRSRSNGEYSSGYSWSAAVRFGTWIPRTHEEIEEAWPNEVDGKMWVQVQIGPTVHEEMLSVEHASAVVARDERLRRDSKVFVEFDKPEFVLGENIMLHYAVKNTSTEPLTISVGSDYRGSPRALRFKVHAFDEDGKRVADPSPNPWNMGGIGISPEVKPGETYWLSIALAKYARFEKAGTYRLKVFHDLGWNERQFIPETTDNSLPKNDTVAPVVEATIKIREPSLADAKAVIEEARKPHEPTGWGKRLPPFGALWTASYPVYLPLLEQEAKDNEMAINAIAGITTPEATTVLIKLAKDSVNARLALQDRLPHPFLRSDRELNANWKIRKRQIEQSWLEEFREPVMKLAWTLLEPDDDGPSDDRKRDWKTAGSYVAGVGQAADFERFVDTVNPIVESLGNVNAEQQQFPSPPTVIANLVAAGSELIKDGATPTRNPKSAFESMMFMTAIHANANFRPDGWKQLAKRLLGHSMPRVRATCLDSLPVPIDEEFVKPIIACSTDSSPLVAATVFTKVGQLQDARFLETAQEVAKKPGDKWVRDAASYAVTQIKKATQSQPTTEARTPPANDAPESKPTREPSNGSAKVTEPTPSKRSPEASPQKKGTVAVQLMGEAIAGVPLQFQLNVTNHTKQPFQYWCGGPGSYPNANVFEATFTDEKGVAKKLRLHNGQYVEGSGTNRNIDKHQSFPAACDPLPPGKYTLTVGRGMTAVLGGAIYVTWPEMISAPITITVKDSPDAIRRADEVLIEQAKTNPFAKHVARVYGIDPVVNDWLKQLMDDDATTAFKSVGYLQRCQRLPKGGDDIIKQAALKHIRPKQGEPDKNLLRYISLIARNIRSDTTLDAVMTIASADVDHYARWSAVRDLGEFPQPRAEQMLLKFADDADSPLYWSAIEGLAARRNRVALKALLKVVESDVGERRIYYGTMLRNFPDDPEARAATDRLLMKQPSNPKPSSKGAPSPDQTKTSDKSESSNNAAEEDAITRERRTLLTKHADSFRLLLQFSAPHEEPYYALALQSKTPQEFNYFMHRAHQIDRKQLAKLIDGLAKGGFLKRATAGRPKITNKEGYLIYISCQEYSQYEVLGFQDNEETLGRLTALYSSLDGEVAQSMSLFLERLGVRTKPRPNKGPAPKPLPQRVRLRVFRGMPSPHIKNPPTFIDKEFTPGKPFKITNGNMSISGTLSEERPGLLRFKASLFHAGGTNEFDTQPTLGKPTHPYAAGFASGILLHVLQLDEVN